MPGRSKPSGDGKLLREYAALARLGHSPERLAELAPEVLGLYARLQDLWGINVDDVEIALAFTVEDDRA